MATYNNTKAAQHAVTTRLNNSDHIALLAEAERLGSNPSQLMRTAWSDYQEKQSIDTRLGLLESRLTRRLFEIVSAVAGLTPTQRQEAMSEAKLNLRRDA